MAFPRRRFGSSRPGVIRMATEKKQTWIWWVEHPDHTDAVVIADNWEQATVEAAKWWEVPWGKVAAMCSVKKKEPLLRGVCCECGAKMWSPGGPRTRCAKCEAVARDRELNRKARNKKFYASMHAE